jgi:hypothetical protein
MKATLTFNLPDEFSDLQMAMKGYKYLLVLWDLDQEWRSKIKYTEEETVRYEDLRTDIRDRLEEYGCSLEDGE